jgi:uncharacterized protein YigA (DUF484 family)
MTPEKWLEQHERMMADLDIKMAESEVRHQKAMERIDQRLDRAVRLAVQDARRQRERNAEFDQRMTEITALQRTNEQLLKAFLERGGNGKH